MEVVKTGLEGLYVIRPKVHEDHRGFFLESYNSHNFKEQGIDFAFVQDNHSLSVEPGVLRGLHYQLPPKAQTKLVRVISGAIYDVAVDIRAGSPTFGQWFGVILSESNKQQLLIPRGFAHGFCTIVANTQVLYKVDDYYSPEHDRGIRWDDPAIGIAWPAVKPILSEKDRNHPLLKDAQIHVN
ncbi:dTDP-4-dehydrorhamnose 3,5-epimerase [Paenibacillus athensensis]|uniref:dTDP-4-dehydrorhamnose 3,5-epimerase n=1 Tax=Paenibacillus athensensis TaxID=1967502 RepID=A0A4Y8Q5C8_9BACL|nr:dTDP-4-dehydrorhamnose 3,5-epimerase [Paenibacillus athensensis]MCD1259514.1 dTDP-4-dehydrorhamnose 3,5-epimerase [Paenibacillus athensensis]